MGLRKMAPCLLTQCPASFPCLALAKVCLLDWYCFFSFSYSKIASKSAAHSSTGWFTWELLAWSKMRFEPEYNDDRLLPSAALRMRCHSAEKAGALT